MGCVDISAKVLTGIKQFSPVIDDWYAIPTPQNPLSLAIPISPDTLVPWLSKEVPGKGSGSPAK